MRILIYDRDTGSAGTCQTPILSGSMGEILEVVQNPRPAFFDFAVIENSL